MFKKILAIILGIYSTALMAQTPDFSSVDSLAKAQALFAEGKLEKLYLFPLEYGGQDIPQNLVYVPIGFADIKRKIDGTVGKMLKDGSVARYTAEPEYKGKSFVPSKIKIRAWHPDKKGEFVPTIEIW